MSLQSLAWIMNEWIRSAVCDFLVTIDGKWNIADVHVTLKPLVEPYLQPGRVLYRLNSKLVLSDYLAQPLPRDVWTRVMHLNHLNTRKLVQLLDNHMRRGDPFISNEDWFKKIFAHSELGVTVRSDMNPDSPIKPSTKEDRENERSRIVKQLYAFRNLLPKMAVLRTSGVEPHRSRNEGRVELSTFVPKEKFRKFAFNQPAKEPDMQINTNSYVNDKFDEDQETEDGGTQAEEFRKISVPHSNQIKTSVFEMNVFKLLDHLSLVRERGVVPKRSNLQNASSVHRRGGVLITHLHEHSDTVNKLALTKNGKTLASASKDGTIRLWKSRTIAGEGSGEARSHLAFNPTGGSSEVFSVGWYQDCVVATTRDGQITWTNVETDRKQVTRLTIPSDEGPPLCAQTFGPLTFVRTHHGVFYGLDTRVGRTYGPLGRHETWRKKVESCEGMVLCNAVDPFQQAWMAIGTMAQSENIIIWDLRFQIEAMRLKNPPKLRPNGIYVDPSKPSEPQLYVAYDYQGDVSAYKLCEAERQRHTVLWTGTEPLVYPTVKFNDPERETNRVNALCVCESSGLVYTGDRMGALRLWDTQRVDKSRAISMPQKVPGRYIFVHREKRSEAPDQPRVIYETAYLNSENTKIKIAPLEARPSTNHRSGITDMLLMNDGLMATSSVDGIIKIWK